MDTPTHDDDARIGEPIDLSPTGHLGQLPADRLTVAEMHRRTGSHWPNGVAVPHPGMLSIDSTLSPEQLARPVWPSAVGHDAETFADALARVCAEAIATFIADHARRLA